MPLCEKSKQKLLLIGIDGGTFDIIIPLIKEGKLPNISALLHNGIHSELLSTIPPVTAPAWSSFITGTNPGKHGVFYFFDRDLNNYKISGPKKLMNLSNMKGVPFWRVLNKHGQKAGLINVPLTYPPDKLDGFMISGMLVPPEANDYVYPTELSGKLEDYRVDLEGLMVQNRWQARALIKEDREKFVRDVYKMSEKRAQNTIKLIKEEVWDFLAVVFTGSDRISHFFWEDVHGGESAASVLKDYYIFLDEQIGRLLKAAPEDATKVIISDHGFGKAPDKSINAFVLMRILGGTALVSGNKLSCLKKLFYGKLRLQNPFAMEDLVDWERSQIFPVPIYGNFLGICINTKKEKRLGIVSAGKEYNSIKQGVIARLNSLKDPDSGEKLVTQIHFREDIYPGRFMNQAPDMIVQFSYDYNIEFSPFKRTLVRKSANPIRTGDHRREGIFIASGPKLRTGNIERKIYIEDVTSSILYLLGVPIPDSYDGALIKELFDAEHLAKHPPQFEKTGTQFELESEGSTKKDQDEFEESKQMLKSLGYL